MTADLLPRGPVELDVLRRVRRAAMDVLEATGAEPCQDVEGCLAVVYMAGVADALAWAAGEGPLPRTFRERVA